MSEQRIKARWLRWNLLGEGKDRSPFENAKYAYRGVVLYAHDWPVGRFVRLKNGNGVVLYMPGGYATMPKLLLGPSPYKLVDCVSVDSIGVFSKYDGDMIDDAALHERLRWLFGAKAALLVEQAQILPVAQLVDRSRAMVLTGDMISTVDRYRRYAGLFELKWPEFPPTYLKSLTQIIERRSVKYNDSIEVAKRERKAARKEAKQALGLDE